MQIMGLTSVASITVMVYLIALLVKATPLPNKWLPIICGITGGVLGVLAKFFMPQFPVSDIFDAVAVGIVSGLAATGVNEALKIRKK
ncbi:MAG: phage holin family protein [Oscillospiraceae bacterium]|jgi:hypothetical protein|nr:phage holin family protein [Oscillospiraceae bacterium]